MTRPKLFDAVIKLLEEKSIEAIKEILKNQREYQIDFGELAALANILGRHKNSRPELVDLIWQWQQ